MDRAWKLSISIVVGVCSLAFAALLIFLLLRLSRVDLRATVHILASVRWPWLALMVALTAINTLLAAEKWRIANAVAEAPPPSLFASFSLTAVGGALGQILPAQMSTAVARVAGARTLGGGTMLRAGATTIFEQIFDFLAFLCFALASFLTLAIRGQALLWTALVLVILPACWLGAGHGANRAATSIAWLLRHTPSGGAGARFAGAFASVGRAEPKLARQLFLLSVLRFGTIVALCIAITAATGLRISAWRLAAALPFAVIAVGVAVTPAGLGVAEWAMCAALFAFGTEMRTAVQWGVLSRILSAAASAAVGLVGGAMTLWLWRGRLQARRGTSPDAPAS